MWNQLGNEAMCKDGVVLHMMIKPTKDTLILHSHFSCSFSFLLFTVTTAMNFN